PEIMAGPIYRKYEKATRKVWNAKLLDYASDQADWARMTEGQRAGIATITVRFEAGEQEVRDELLPRVGGAGLPRAAERGASCPPRTHRTARPAPFRAGEPVYEGLPKYGRRLSAA